MRSFWLKFIDKRENNENKRRKTMKRIKLSEALRMKK